MLQDVLDIAMRKQTQRTMIRQKPFYKQLRVKTKMNIVFMRKWQWKSPHRTKNDAIGNEYFFFLLLTVNVFSLQISVFKHQFTFYFIKQVISICKNKITNKFNNKDKHWETTLLFHFCSLCLHRTNCDWRSDRRLITQRSKFMA